MTYRLGQEVLFTRTLTRRAKPRDGRQGSRKVWETEDWPGQPEPAPRRGIVVGVRRLTNGWNEWYGWDEPITYHPETAFTAYLVAHHLRRKPVLVLPDHLEPLHPPTPEPVTPDPQGTLDL